MRGRGSPLLLALLAVTMLASACVTSPSGGAASAERPGARTPQKAVSRLALVLEGEPANLASKLETRVGAVEVNNLTNAPLSYLDDKGLPHAHLAVDLPSRDKGTWSVSPDGTMTTTWTIRPDAIWHDGQPVTSRDFVLALRVYQDPAVPVVTREPETFIDRIEALDDKSFVIYWRQAYPWAYRLINRELEALPAHLLGSLYDGPDKAAFINARFWSTEYVGNGPFRLETWTQGVSLQFRAFDGFFLGRPRLDEVVVTWQADPAVLVAQLLSGVGDTVGSGNVLVTLDSYASLKEQWERTGAGRVMVNAGSNRYLEIQQDPARTQQPALLDVRVRQALAHGMDRIGIARIIVGPEVPAGDHVFGVFPSEPVYARIDAAAPKYPYDQRRALALLQEAGWTKQGDTLLNAAGQPFTLTLWSRPGLEKQVTLLANNLDELGMKTTVFSVPSNRLEEPEYRATFPGLNIFGTSNRMPRAMLRMTSAQCPTPPRFAGTNYGCWSNAEYDRNYQIAVTTLDEEERAQAMIAAYRAMYADVGFIWLNYNTSVTPIRRGLEGYVGNSPGSGILWNAWQWGWANQ